MRPLEARVLFLFHFWAPCEQDFIFKVQVCEKVEEVEEGGGGVGGGGGGGGLGQMGNLVVKCS